MRTLHLFNHSVRIILLRRQAVWVHPHFYRPSGRSGYRHGFTAGPLAVLWGKTR